MTIEISFTPDFSCQQFIAARADATAAGLLFARLGLFDGRLGIGSPFVSISFTGKADSDLYALCTNEQVYC